MRVEPTAYLGWKNCLRLSSGGLELVVTLDVGPRIIHLSPQGGKNLLYVFPNEAGKTGGAKWRSYGGHRLWYAPEKMPYPPDNHPIEYKPIKNGLRLTQAPEKNSKLQKQIEITATPGKPGFKILHRIINRGRSPKKIAPWALTVLRAGGHATLPLPPRIPFPKKLLPSGTLRLWPYTDLKDKRYSLESTQVRFHADPKKKKPQKFGIWVPQGKASYSLNGLTFTKEFGAYEKAEYPDGGVNAEVFAVGPMIELETLGPWVDLSAGKSVEHMERWRLEKSHRVS